MAHTAGSFPLAGSSHRASVQQTEKLPQQLTRPANTFATSLMRPTGISRRYTGASAGAAISFPASYPRVNEVGRALLRTTSTSLSNSAEVLKRTLSTKVISAPAEVLQVHSAEELQDLLQKHEDKLVVLMCKAAACRPCKMFARKYQRIAAEHVAQGAVFLEILGDESTDTRKLMMSMQIRVTPTFCLFRGKELVKTVTGVNADNLQNAVREHLQLAQDKLLP